MPENTTTNTGSPGTPTPEQKRAAAVGGSQGGLPGAGFGGGYGGGYGGMYGRNRGRMGRWGNWGQQQQTPPNFNTDLESVLKNLGGLLPKSFGGALGSLGQTYSMATDLANEENRRQQEGFGMVRDYLSQADRLDRGMSQREIDLRLGLASDAATEGMMQNASAARSMLGQSGVIGGSQAAALEGALRLGRMGQIQKSRGELAADEAARRGEAANRMFERGTQAAEFLSQGPSMLQLDQLNSIVDTGLNAFLGEKQYQAARKASKDKKTSSIAGSVFSLLPIPK